MALREVHERVNAPVAASGARVDAGNGARILTLDIECSPTVAHVWGLWDQNVGLNQIVEDGRMICFAAKWYGDSQTLFFSDEKDGHEAMVEAAWRLLDECDVLVSFNGVKYDVKHLNREFVLAGLGSRPKDATPSTQYREPYCRPPCRTGRSCSYSCYASRSSSEP